eukprot:3417175-Rhodomonas_salina.1
MRASVRVHISTCADAHARCPRAETCTRAWKHRHMDTWTHGHMGHTHTGIHAHTYRHARNHHDTLPDFLSPTFPTHSPTFPAHFLHTFPKLTLARGERCSRSGTAIRYVSTGLRVASAWADRGDGPGIGQSRALR